jgi:flagellar basal-body rod protein FlgB
MNNYIGKKLYDQTMDLLSRSLDIRTSRHKILSSNIANVDTNNFTPKDLPFQKILERHMSHSFHIEVLRSHPRHFPGYEKDSNQFSADIESAPLGEGVNIDQEMGKLAENNVMFQAGIQAMLKKFEAIKIAISETK